MIDAGVKPTSSAIIEQMHKISDTNNLELSEDLKNYRTINQGDNLELPNVGSDSKDVQAPKDIQPPKDAQPKPPVNEKTAKPAPLTPEERSEARHYGSNVSDYLVGYTTDSEQGLTKEVIKQYV